MDGSSESATGPQDRRFAEGWAAVKGEPAHFFPVKESPHFANVFSYSIGNFAMRVFTLGEADRYVEANEAIIQNCRYYEAHPDTRDGIESYYWSLGLFLRVLNKYGSHGAVDRGRLGAEAERALIAMMWSYCADHADFNDSESRRSKAWRVYWSENHKLMKDTAIWGQAVLLCECDDYADRLIGGHALREHVERYNDYLKCWMNERARKSMFIETGSRCYMHETMKSVYHIYELTRDEELKRIAKGFLDLFWATWAQEQLDGVYGGGAARMIMHQSLVGRCHGVATWGYYYFGLGRPVDPFYVDADRFSVLDSSYRVPETIVRLACEPEKRGTYTIEMRPYGLNDWSGPFKPGDYPLLDWGGIYRYSYCTPKHIIGCLMSEQLPHDTFMRASMQNRFQGAVFASHEDARIYVSPEFIGDDGGYNSCWNEQCEGTLITQQCRYANGTGVMRVWFSDAGGLSDVTERGGWIFTRTEGAFAAARFVSSGYTFERQAYDVPMNGWMPEFARSVSGLWARAADRFSPVIIETATDDMFDDFEAFISAVLVCRPIVDDDALRYHSLYGHDFVFGLVEGVDSTIDGEHYVKQLPYSHKSPFVNGAWDDDEVAITFDGETHTLDFSYSGP